MEENTGILDALVFGVPNTGANHAEDSEGTSRFWGPATGINWCEIDYEVSPYIAEFWNTISNIGFLLVGIYGFVLVRRYRLPTRFLEASAFFHATLWWSGQKSDEAFENIALILIYYFDRDDIFVPLLHSAVVTFGIFFVSFLLVCEIHLISIVILALHKSQGEAKTLEGQTSGKSGLTKSLRIAAIAGASGALCWLIDRLACQQMRGLPVNPQFHMWWHLLCALPLQHALVLTIAIYRYREGLQKKLDEIQQPLVSVNSIGLVELQC